MQSLAASTGSKWIANKPLYPGDLFNNHGCYWPVPNYTDPYWRKAHALAEKLSYGRSDAKAGFRKQAMFYAPASSGPAIIREIMSYPARFIDKAREFSPNDTPYVTLRGAAAVLDPDRRAALFQANYNACDIQGNIAADNINAYIVTPAAREMIQHVLADNPSILEKITFEDAVFEKHFWQPFCLFDATQGIYSGPHAWSFNAALEKALGVVVQYGASMPLAARRGQGFDVTDVWGRPVSIVDQAWEDARALVDVVGTKITLEDGAVVPFRYETGAALLLVRFMYDDFFRNRHPSLARGQEHEVVRAHCTDAEDQKRFAQLKKIMLPYLAARCDWPTLHRILDQDAALKKYWDEEVKPLAGRVKPDAEIEKAIFSYLPRGGYESTAFRVQPTERRDAPQHLRMPAKRLAPGPRGQRANPFAREFDNVIFEDRAFARLGGTSSSQDEPDPDHLTRPQAAALMTIFEGLPDGVPPANANRTLLYVDDAAGGLRASAFAVKNKIDWAAEQAAAGNPSLGRTFAEEVAAENLADFSDRIRKLAFGEKYAVWRTEHAVGNILAPSDISASLKRYEGYREGTATPFSEALAAEGSLKLGGEVASTVVRRLIAFDLHGMVLPQGDLSSNAYRYITEGVLAAVGLTGRPYDGGKYQFEFFMDEGAELASPLRPAPRKLDFADLLIHVGMKAKHDLEQRHPPKNRDLYVTMARLSQVYEMLIDPDRCNTKAVRDAKSGKDSKQEIVDWKQVDPSFIGFMLHQPVHPSLALMDAKQRGVDGDYQAFLKDPDYQAFVDDKLDIEAWCDDPARKAKLAYMMWFYMRVQAVDAPGIEIPVTGQLLVKGIHAFDRDDTIDLPKEYQEARHWWHNLAARQKQNVLGLSRTVQLRGAAVSVS